MTLRQASNLCHTARIERHRQVIGEDELDPGVIRKFRFALTPTLAPPRVSE